MALDGKLLRQARAQHAQRKAEWERRLRRRQGEVYALLPRMLELDQALRETIIDTIQVALSTDGEPERTLEHIGQRNQALQRERRTLLEQAGLPGDYLDEIPMCPICKDTGHDGSGICTCVMELYRELQAQELSNLLNLGEENFEHFSLDYYDDRTIHAQFGLTARQNMASIFQVCRQYAHSFGPSSPNLFLIGEPGLGKTFLSSCIAKVVSESGFSVVYDTASAVFAQFEAEKFNRGEEPELAQSEINRYLNCDLLILDDLGTEMTTSFITSALYTLVNTRLMRGRKTVISSNYSLETLGKKYSPQIMSRLEGEYEVLTFFGQDIRRLKKAQNLFSI